MRRVPGVNECEVCVMMALLSTADFAVGSSDRDLVLKGCG